MLKQLAPKARMPPSPKMTAWMSSAIETDKHAASGPKSKAMSVPPTACPVVPPGSGTLNIMSRNENAAAMPMKATCLASSFSWTFLAQCTQMGTIATPSTASVAGER